MTENIAVRLPRTAVDFIVEHARAARPAECCGLLIGTGLAVVEAVPMPNLSADLSRYVIAPDAHLAARRLARERKLQVLGFYHSHPHSPPEPSATDLIEATYPDDLYLIVSLASPEPRIRLFRFRAAKGFVEEPYSVEAPPRD